MKNRLTGILTLVFVAASQAQWVLVDDFDAYNNSSSTLIRDGITYDAAVGKDVWTGIPDGTGRAHIYDNTAVGGQSIAAYADGAWRGAETDLKNNFTTDFSLSDGSTATYFFQFMTEGSSFDCMFGLTEDTARVDENSSWEDYSVMPYIAGGQLHAFGDNGTGGSIVSVSTGLWYNVWLVVDNAAKTYDIYWSSGTTNASTGQTGVEFGRVTDPANLEAFAFTQNLSATVRVDNLYRAGGVNLTFPSTDIVIIPPPPPPPYIVGGALAGVTNDPVYLMCYHEGYYPAGGNSGVFLSWSTNGYDFSPLNNGHPVFVPPEFPGDDADNTDGYQNLVRDPSIVYGPDGLYHMVFTSDIHSRSFGYAESPDLVNWSNVKLVQIWENEPASVGRTWAPEVFYDDELNQYQVAFSSDVDGGTLRLYYTTTPDFETFSDPAELYWYPSGSWEQIDGFVAKVDTGQYIMSYKESAEIWVMDSTTPHGPWTNPRQATAGGDEGPALLRIGDTWHLYYDNYGQGDDVFGLSISTDTINWTDVTALADMPEKSDVPDYGYDGGPPHHSTVFAAPLSTLGAFTEPLEDNLTNLTYMVHRWSFNDPAGSVSDGTVIMDSVSGAAAAVNGNRANLTGTGLLLPGDTDGTGDAAYLDLPNGIISAQTNLTLEIWATPIASKNWQRLFSFGRTAEDGDGGGEWTGPASGGTSALNAMYWTLNDGTDISKQQCAMRDYEDIHRDAVSGTCMNTSPGTQYHYVFTFEDGTGFFGATGGRMAFYRDGCRIGWRDVAFRLQDLEDVNNWLGRSQWSGDSNANLEYNEVRIYSEALNEYDIYGHYLAGPEVPVIEIPTLSLVAADGTNTLTWPGNAVGMALLSTESLSISSTWTWVANDIVNTTNGLQVVQPHTSENEFYRLGK